MALTGENEITPDPVEPVVLPTVAAVVDGGAPAQDRKSVKAEQRRQLVRDPSFIIGALVLLFWILCALLPALLANYGPDEAVVTADGQFLARSGPDGTAWFGTDSAGRDVYSRVIYGARNVLTVAPIAAAAAVAAGAILGLLMGFFRGWVDELISRISEAVLSLPVILLAILVLVVFGTSKLVIILTVAALFTPVVARTVRSAVLSEAQLDYVTSAKLRGESSWFIMTREILPNITNVLVVEFTVRVGYAIFTVATLAFLGFTSDATAPDWGNDIASTYTLINANQWWPTIFPALAIASLVIAVNLIADSLDKALKS
ncbi:MAG: ABC transporter permease [Acidimicrobiales bacterium]|nr:ABC transporter permease [Acidimicrobiales bacterium]